MRLPSLSFASQMHSLANEDEKANSQAALQAKEVPKMPLALTALPVRPTRCGIGVSA